MNEDILLGLKLAITNTEQELTNEIDSLVTAAQKKAKAVQLDLNIDEGLKKLEKTLNGKLKGVNFNPELKKFFEAFSSGDIKDIGKAYEEINNKALLLTKNLTDAQLKLMDGWSGEQVNKFVKRIIKANKDIEKATKKQSKYENIPEYVKKTRASENSIKKTLQGKKNKSDEEILDQFERAGLDVNKITKKELSSFTYYEKLLSYQKELIDNDKALANPKTQKEADAQIENAQKLIKVTELLGRSREQLIEIGKKLNQNEDFTIDEVQSIDSNLATKYAQEWNKIVDKAIAEIRKNINSNLAEELEETSSKYLSAKVERNTVAINQQRAKRAKAIAPVDKEDVGTTEQYTEALNGVDNELDDVQEGVTTTANSLGKLKEEFKDVEKYLVDFETALKELNKLSSKDILSKNETDDLIGYISRINNLDILDKLTDEQQDRYYEVIDKLNEKLYYQEYSNLTDIIIKKRKLEKDGKPDVDNYSEYDKRRLNILKQVEEATRLGAEAYDKEAQSAKHNAEAQQNLANAKKEVAQESSESTNEQTTLLAFIDIENLKKQLQEVVKDFDVKFSDAFNNNIKEFSNNFSNIDYKEILEPFRQELLALVYQFKNSLKDVGIDNSKINELYETLSKWNVTSQLSLGKDQERLMLGNLSNGRISPSVIGKEAEVGSEEQRRLLNKVSASLEESISEIFDTWIHTHPFKDKQIGSDIGFSYGDLSNEINRYFSEGIKKMLVSNNGKYSLLDFSSIIDKNDLKDFLSSLVEIAESDKYKDKLTVHRGGTTKFGQNVDKISVNESAVSDKGIIDADKKTEILNSLILDTIQSSEKLQNITLTTGDIADLKIGEVIKDEKALTDQSETLLDVLTQIRNIISTISTGNGNGGGLFDVYLTPKIDSLITEIQNKLYEHTFTINVGLDSGQLLGKSDESAINTEGFAADRVTDSLNGLNHEKTDNIELNAKLRKNANESAKALANEAEKAEMADKALTELNKRKRTNNKLNEEKPEPKKNKSNLLLDKVNQELRETGNTAETESTTLLSLLDPLDKIKESITEKNNLFLAENEIVKSTVWEEINNLSLLLSCVEEIIQAIKDLNSQFGNLSFDSLTRLMNQFKPGKRNDTNIEGIVENLTKLAKGLNELKIDDTGFIDSVNRIIDASKDLKNVVKDAETVNKAVKDSSGKVKKPKERSTKEIFADQLENEKKYIGLIRKARENDGLDEKDTITLEETKQELEKISSEFEKIDFNTEEARNALADYNREIQNIENNIAKGIAAGNRKADQKATQASADELQSQIDKYNKLQDKAKVVFKNSDKYVESFRKSLKSISEENIDLTNIDRIKDKIKELENSLDEKTLKANLEGTYTKLLSFYEKIQKQLATEPHMASDIKMQYRALADEIDNLIKSGNVLPGTLNKITKAFIELNAQDAKNKGFFRSVADRAREMNVKFLGQFFSFYDIIRYGREIFGVIQELDTSLVDLRKTTAMSTNELEEYYYESNKIAKQMGVTTNEIISQSAAWSRLGFNTAEATKEMTQLSSKFASISPGMTTDEAQSGIVSIVKAWDIATDDVEREVLDNINTLGKLIA